MIDVASPECLPLRDIADRVCRGQGRKALTRLTLMRYITRGRAGVRLEAVKVGNAWHSTLEALNRFLADSSRVPGTPEGPAVSEDPDGRPAGKPSAEVARSFRRAESMGL